VTPSDDNPYRLSMDDLERSAHVAQDELVEEEEADLVVPRELPDTNERAMRVPLQPRRVTMPDGHGEIDRQLTRVLLGVVALFVIAFVGFLVLG
jgi:hypothetical protein